MELYIVQYIWQLIVMSFVPRNITVVPQFGVPVIESHSLEAFRSWSASAGTLCATVPQPRWHE